jgi:hypothetical protein
MVENRHNRGGKVESERLPELRWYRICCEAVGHEWSVRRGRIYPIKMSRLRRHRTDTANPAFHCELTAQRAVIGQHVPAWAAEASHINGGSGRT